MMDGKIRFEILDAEAKSRDRVQRRSERQAIRRGRRPESGVGVAAHPGLDRPAPDPLGEAEHQVHLSVLQPRQRVLPKPRSR